MEAQQIQELFSRNVNDPYIIENSLQRDGVSELFILLATNDMLKVLLKHGAIHFFMDGMHGVNRYENNQLVTLNVVINMKGYPCAHLITDR